jgi:hypothetical protein
MRLHTPVLAALLTVLRAPTVASGAILEVPTRMPTIQRAVDAARPGDVVRVRPGTYRESVRITGARTGITIEAADPRNPPTILGTPNASFDGIRVEYVDGIRLQNLRIHGAYDGVRLINVHEAVLSGLVVTDSALGIRVYRGSDNAIIGSTIAVTRVEEGIRIDGSPRAILADTLVERCDGGIRVLGSPSTLLLRTRALQNTGDGINVYRSGGTRLQGCAAHGNVGNGIRVSSSPTVTLLGNTADDNLDVGLRIGASPPFASVADVSRAGNRASRNRNANVVVQPLLCNSTSCSTTTTTTPRVTTTTIRSVPSLMTAAWRFYVSIRTTAGTSRAVDVPAPVSSPPIQVAIRTAHLSAFRPGVQLSGAEVAALGGDTIGRLTAAADAYLRAQRARYPDFVAIGAVRWVMRVAP